MGATPGAYRRLAVGAGAAAVAQRADGVADAVGELGEGLELEGGVGRGPLDVDDEELAARLADDVAEAGDVHPVAAVEDAEPEVEVRPARPASPCPGG